MKNLTLIFCMLLAGFVNANNDMSEKVQNENMEIATLGAGCFWCVEAIFQELKGVDKVVSGYMGGKEKASYKEVCTGLTGHAEVCQISFNPSIISFKELLEVFWHVHNPTTLNRQGADVGTQYRSVIFYNNDEQKELSEAIKKKLNESGAWDDPVITEITASSTFYPAENYHQDYFNNNTSQTYCTLVIKPKQEKFKKVFKDKLK
ncbi:peptide-methionine (S)-S-oxide reductase [Labilibaculum filiforme]|uniref:Peptide methionine sulfoxide reductase MsrA n=1 Tax=Labilibaculum filiforme TaxID=1940526 RepID=A0A2N3HW40_9BACT|nr:peptide-methionine (S)-S-oxide reductase MsrA [Labilibaculum filiforme]PKQ62248.1 peptide-methionine (S)-S-oxide reductase [Labilibaculum filiforme]